MSIEWRMLSNRDMKEGREIIMANCRLLKTYHENDRGLHEKKWIKLQLSAVAGKFLEVIVGEALSRALLGLWLANWASSE